MEVLRITANPARPAERGPAQTRFEGFPMTEELRRALRRAPRRTLDLSKFEPARPR